MPQNTIAEFQKVLREFVDARDWDQFHSPKNLSMAMAVEVAELVEIFQWLTEDQSRNLDDAALNRVAAEMADIFIYLLRLADKLEIDVFRATRAKIELNSQKYPAELVRGDARKYDEYD